MRKTGYLGEGGFMMRNNLYGMNVERTVRYDVHELRIKDWESMIGQPIEEALDLKSDQKAILGYYNGNPITAGGQKTTSRTSSKWETASWALRSVRPSASVPEPSRSGQGLVPVHQRRIHSHQGRTEPLSPGCGHWRLYPFGS